MKRERYLVEVSQNGWEYTGYVTIDCEGGIVHGEDNKTIYAGDVRIKFDEEVGRIRRVNNLGGAK